MLRLRKTRWKIAYIAIGVGSLFVLNGGILSHLLPDPIYAVVANLLTVLLYFIGVRSFRGAGEPVQPPRAWWRMTSRPRAGFVIGSLLILSFADGVFVAVSGPSDLKFAGVLSAIVDASLAFFYFRSSILLRRVPPLTVQEAPHWKPIKSQPLQ